jgi:hypothetical protein
MAVCEYALKRGCKKIHYNVGARNFFGFFSSFGTVKNLSGNCICIDSKMCLPLNSTIQLHIPSKENTLNVSVRVEKYINAAGFHDTLTGKVLNPSKEYLEFVENFSPIS